MKRWLHDNPWIWLLLFMIAVVMGSLVTIMIAELHRPEIVSSKKEWTSPGQDSAFFS